MTGCEERVTRTACREYTSLLLHENSIIEQWMTVLKIVLAKHVNQPGHAKMEKFRGTAG